MDELQSQESLSDGILKEVVSLWSEHEVRLRSVYAQVTDSD